MKIKIKKVLKILSLFISIALIFVIPFGITASAETGTVYKISHQLPSANNYDGYAEVLMRNPENGSLQVYTYYWCGFVSGYESTESDKFPRMTLTVTTKSIGFNYSYNSVLASDSYSFGLLYGYIRSVDGAYTHDYVGNNTNYNITGSFWVADWLEIVGIKVHGNGKIAYSPIDDFNYGDWSVIYGGDNALYNELQSIKSILQSQNNNDIIANQDKNASEIQQNQDENTSKITNGWNSDASTDTTTTDDYADKESGLIDSTAEGRAESISIFKNFDLLITDGVISRGLLFCTTVFKTFLDIPWFGNLVKFGLALGIFAFVIGMGMILIKSRKGD